MHWTDSVFTWTLYCYISVDEIFIAKWIFFVSVNVTLQFIQSKCIFSLLYDLKEAHTGSQDFVISRFLCSRTVDLSMHIATLSVRLVWPFFCPVQVPNSKKKQKGISVRVARTFSRTSDQWVNFLFKRLKFRVTEREKLRRCDVYPVHMFNYSWSVPRRPVGQLKCW